MRSSALRMAAAASALLVILPNPAFAGDELSPRADCKSGPYIVFFDRGKSDITAEAATILDSAIAAYGHCDHAPIMLSGHTDRSGGAAYNKGLSVRRNDTVRAYLTGHGLPQGAITGQAYGEEMPRVPTADGVREPQNRRVEMTFGPGPEQ